MVLHLAEQLDVPLRERNRMLLAAGYAPVYAQRPLDAPELAPVKDALDQLLAGHEPFPAIVVDRAWNLVAANAAIAMLTAGAAPHLLEPPVNALRLALHPDGMAPRIVNLGEWRAHLLARPRRAGRRERRRRRSTRCYEELRRYPGRTGEPAEHDGLRPAAHPRRPDRAALPQHPHHVRHRGRRHGLRAGDRVVLPRRRGRLRSRRVEVTLEVVEPVRPVAAVRRRASDRPRPAARDRARTSASARPPAPAPGRPRAAPAGAWRRRAATSPSVRDELVDRPLALEQQVEDLPPAGIRQDVEDRPRRQYDR